MVVAIEVVEGGVGQPGLVEVQGVDLPVEHLLDGLDVVDDAVVGALGDGEDARAPFGVPGEGIGGDLALDVLPVEFVQWDGADDPVVVAGRHQEDRDGPGDGDGVQDGLVAVAVHHHDVAGGHGGVPDDLVGRRCAVGDEEEVVGVEDARGVALRGRHRAGVVEQLAQFFDGVADVGPQHVLAEELVEHLAHRALQEGHAAGVPRAVPGIGTVRRVVDQGAEEGRGERVEVVARLADDVAGDELRGVLEHVDEAVQLAQHVVGDVPGGAGLAVEEDGDVRVAEADLLHEGAQLGDGRRRRPRVRRTPRRRWTG